MPTGGTIYVSCRRSVKAKAAERRDSRTPRLASPDLLQLAVNRMAPKKGVVLLQLDPRGSRLLVLRCRVSARGGSDLSGLCALERHDDAVSLLSHNSTSLFSSYDWAERTRAPGPA